MKQADADKYQQLAQADAALYRQLKEAEVSHAEPRGALIVHGQRLSSPQHTGFNRRAVLLCLRCCRVSGQHTRPRPRVWSVSGRASAATRLR